MDGFSRLMGLYMRHYNTAFWLVFLVAGALFIGSAALGLFSLGYLDLVLGLALAAAGIHRMGDEFFKRSSRKAQEDMARTVSELLQWAEKSYDYTREFKDKHERRLHRLDQKRAQHEQETEELFRDAVKKIIQMENRLSRAIRAMESPGTARSGRADMPLQDKTGHVPSPAAPVTAASDRPLQDRSATVKADKPSPAKPMAPRVRDLNAAQSKAISHMRKSGTITNKEYRKLFRVTEKKAYSDLSSMRRMGLIRRRGKGRGTHYVLAF